MITLQCLNILAIIKTMLHYIIFLRHLHIKNK